MRALRRTSRMLSHYKGRNVSRTSINVVSLMDIFTILVFFLLVNSSEVNVLPSSKSVHLPQSVAEKLPEVMLTVVVNEAEIVVQGRVVASVHDALASTRQIIPGLEKELGYQLIRQMASHDPSKPFKGKVTIMGDKKIPYRLLKKIMLTCTQGKYSRISLAVERKIKAQDG